MPASQSVRKEQIGSHWTDFHEIWLNIFRNSVEKSKPWQAKRELYTKTCVNLWQHFADFLLEWGIFQIKICSENHNPILMFSNFFPWKSYLLWKHEKKKHGTAGQVTNDNTVRRMSKVTDTHSICNILKLFQGNNGYANALQCYFYTYIAYLV